MLARAPELPEMVPAGKTFNEKPCVRCGIITRNGRLCSPCVEATDLCRECLKPVEDLDFARCAACRAVNARYANVRAKRRRALRRAVDLCTGCGRNPPTEGGATCYDCKLKVAERESQHAIARRREEVRAAGDTESIFWKD